MDAETLRQYLQFYQDLGIKTLYRRPAPASFPAAATPEVPVNAGPFPLPTLEPLFTAEDLLPYRDAQPPPDQLEAMQRHKLMRQARAKKKTCTTLRVRESV